MRGRRILLQVLVIDAVPLVLCVLVPALWHGQVHDVCNMADVYAWQYLAYIILPLYGCVTAMQVWGVGGLLLYAAILYGKPILD